LWLLHAVREPFKDVKSSGKMWRPSTSQGPACDASPGLTIGERYKLKQRTPRRSIQPPSAMSRFSMIMGNPGAHVICSTDLFFSSHRAAGCGSPPTGIGGMQALTLDPGHISRVGM